MSEIIQFDIDDAWPTRDAVLGNQGIPAGVSVSDEIEGIYRQALDVAGGCMKPVGIVGQISREEFADVYAGEGGNEPRTPVADIFPLAEQLALFTVTVGSPICEEITRRFRSNDLALGAMLDSVASAAADRLAERVESRYLSALRAAGRATPETRALRYSPGYCGWHVSGQAKLFAFLRPERIGVRLNSSHLMQPLKSVSGVILAGPAEIHEFDDVYPFCAACEERGCRERIRALSSR